jgi:hypothetical protein
MSETIGISETDLRHLLDVVDRDRCGGPGEHIPTSVLCDLVTVVACDDVTFQVMDPYRQTGSIQDSGAVEYSGDEEEWDLWWPAFWEHCSYSLRSGDYVSVTRGSDPRVSPDLTSATATSTCWRCCVRTSSTCSTAIRTRERGRPTSPPGRGRSSVSWRMA